MRDIKYLISLWAEWCLAGGAIRSSIGFPRSTVEARIIEGILTTGNPAKSIVPVRIQGVEESRTHKAVMSMPFELRLALLLKHVWTKTGTGKEYVRITDDMRAERWVNEMEKRCGEVKKMNRRCFLREVENAETWLAGHLSHENLKCAHN